MDIAGIICTLWHWKFISMEERGFLVHFSFLCYSICFYSDRVLFKPVRIHKEKTWYPRRRVLWALYQFRWVLLIGFWKKTSCFLSGEVQLSKCRGSGIALLFYHIQGQNMKWAKVRRSEQNKSMAIIAMSRRIIVMPEFFPCCPSFLTCKLNLVLAWTKVTPTPVNRTSAIYTRTLLTVYASCHLHLSPAVDQKGRKGNERRSVRGRR